MGTSTASAPLSLEDEATVTPVVSGEINHEPEVLVEASQESGNEQEVETLNAAEGEE